MGKAYQTCDAKDSRKLAEFLAKEGQLLLPMLGLITRTEAAVNEVIDLVGRATLEAVLLMSAQEVAGPRHPGKAAGEVHLHRPAAAAAAHAEGALVVAGNPLPALGTEVEAPAPERGVPCPLGSLRAETASDSLPHVRDPWRSA